MALNGHLKFAASVSWRCEHSDSAYLARAILGLFTPLWNNKPNIAVINDTLMSLQDVFVSWYPLNVRYLFLVKV